MHNPSRISKHQQQALRSPQSPIAEICPVIILSPSPRPIGQLGCAIFLSLSPSRLCCADWTYGWGPLRDCTCVPMARQGRTGSVVPKPRYRCLRLEIRRERHRGRGGTTGLGIKVGASRSGGGSSDTMSSRHAWALHDDAREWAGRARGLIVWVGLLEHCRGGRCVERGGYGLRRRDTRGAAWRGGR